MLLIAAAILAARKVAPTLERTRPSGYKIYADSAVIAYRAPMGEVPAITQDPTVERASWCISTPFSFQGGR